MRHAYTFCTGRKDFCALPAQQMLLYLGYLANKVLTAGNSGNLGDNFAVMEFGNYAWYEGKIKEF